MNKEIGEKIEEKVNELVSLELERAIEKHGEKFNSKVEAYGVFKEEIEETQEDLKDIIENLNIFWEAIRGRTYKDEMSRSVDKMEYISKLLIQEAAQIAAVAQKYKKSFD